jgi:site-specific DNA-cytosine methylase
VKTHRFTFGALSCGLGAGPKGFVQAKAQLGADSARFVCLGGLDIDPDACADFEYLVRAPALQRDLFEVHAAEVAEFFARQSRALGLPVRRPDAVFTSPPCKGYSPLIGKKAAAKPKYQKLNTLVHVETQLLLEAWGDDSPPLIVIENVPGIMSRGKHLLIEVRRHLAERGYRFHESTHDCGEIGNLAQHRRRFLLVARREKVVSAYVYQPPKHKVRGCGEELGKLPLPETPSAGPLHKLPKISLLNHVRLALIPAGGDWRDLPKRLEPCPDNEQKRPARTITGATRPGSGSRAVTDPRIPLGVDGVSYGGSPGLFGVLDPAQPSKAITGGMAVASSNTPAAVADPRVPVGERRRGAFGVNDWAEPAPTITGAMEPAGSNSPASVADPRIPLDHQPRRDTFGVLGFEHPSDAVRGNMTVRQARAAVADPRLCSPLKPGQPRREVFRRDPVTAWNEPCEAVTGEGGSQGAKNVADPRLALGCEGRNGFYGVKSWQDASGTITGSMAIDNGPAAVADPRAQERSVVALDPALELLARTSDKEAKKAPPKLLVIVSADGTWHRPLTLLDRAVLQGLPPVVDGKPLRLSRLPVPKGKKRMSTIAERIGNAVPVGAGEAIGVSLLKALLASKLGTWFLSSDEIWVRKDGVREDDARFERFEAEVSAL